MGESERDAVGSRRSKTCHQAFGGYDGPGRPTADDDWCGPKRRMPDLTRSALRHRRRRRAGRRLDNHHWVRETISIEVRGWRFQRAERQGRRRCQWRDGRLRSALLLEDLPEELPGSALTTVTSA